MITITEAHIDEALAICEAGGRDGIGYDQARWTGECGTAMCVLGWARLVAGAPAVDAGPSDDEIEDTPRAQTIARLMGCPSHHILKVMRAVTKEGLIDLSGADLSGADLSGANLFGTTLHGADLHGANLSGANLFGTNLHGANLRYADLSGADLRYADLTGAIRD